MDRGPFSLDLDLIAHAVRPGRASSESTAIRLTPALSSVLCSLRPVPSSSKREREWERGRGALSDKVVCGMHVVFSSSAVSRQPSTVDDARFRGPS